MIPILLGILLSPLSYNIFIYIYIFSTLLEHVDDVANITCECCTLRSISIVARPSTVRLDHCHHCLKLRGLICHYCNNYIRKVEEDHDNLPTFVAYLSGLSPHLLINKCFPEKNGIVYVGQNRADDSAPTHPNDTTACFNCSFFRNLWIQEHTPVILDSPEIFLDDEEEVEEKEL